MAAVAASGAQRATRDAPRQQPERDRRDHHAFEVVPEERRADDDHADREHGVGDPPPGRRRRLATPSRPANSMAAAVSWAKAQPLTPPTRTSKVAE